MLCCVALTSVCNSSPNNAAPPHQTEAAKAAAPPNAGSGKSTSVTLKAILAVLDKSLAELPPPPSALAVCNGEFTRLRAIFQTAPGSQDATNANLALLRCTAKATNETKCKGKPQPCGVVCFNPPIKPADPSDMKVVNVSLPDQIDAACNESAAGSSTPDPAKGTVLGSMAGNYKCGAWFKAAAKNDPTLLVAPGFVPNVPLTRDLNTYANGVADTTPDAALATSIERVNYTLITIRLGGAIMPIAILPMVPAGGTPGKVLAGALGIVQHRVNQISKAIEAECHSVGNCPNPVKQP